MSTKREARVATTWNPGSTDVMYVPLIQARHEAMEIARFWHAEGHKVNVRRTGMGVHVMVWDVEREWRDAKVQGSWVITVDVREWEVR